MNTVWQLFCGKLTGISKVFYYIPQLFFFLPFFFLVVIWWIQLLEYPFFFFKAHFYKDTLIILVMNCFTSALHRSSLWSL